MKLYFVYILQCADHSYYTGITNDINRRISEHEEGVHKGSYTYFRRPVTLVHVSEFTDVLHAIAWEKQVKGWSRKKKQALIEDDWDKIKMLSLNSIRKTKME